MTAEAWAPACMDAEELADWESLNARVHVASMKAVRPCADCLPAFADEMRSVGRCNGTPGATEERPVAEPIRLDPKPARPERQVTTPNLPCRSCSHAPVCRIRPSLEETALPVFDVDPAIHAHLSIRCDFYAPDGSVPSAVVAKNPDAPAPKKRTISPEGRARMAEAAQRRVARQRAARGDAEPGDPS